MGTQEFLYAMASDETCPKGILLDALADLEWEKGAEVLTAYVVTGESGEYSDRRMWIVAVFLCQEKSEKFCDKLNQWCLDNHVHKYTKDLDREEAEDRAEESQLDWWSLECPFDPEFRVVYTGVSYKSQEVRLKG